MPLQEPIILPYDLARDLHIHVSFPLEATSATPSGAPALIYFHGGGLFCGNAEMNDWANKWLFEELSKKGVAIISAEYTLLAPNYSGFEIINDVKLLWTYIGTSLNTVLAEKTSLRIDLDRLAVAGSSAGGYLTYLSAIYARSTPAKPRAAFSLYGMGGCFLSDAYVQPKPKGWTAVLGQFAPPAETEQAVVEWLASPPSERAVRVPLYDPQEPRTVMPPWILQFGNLLDILTGVKGLSEKLRAVPLENRLTLLPAETLPLFPECNLSSDLPPFYLLHGAADAFIEVEESRHIAAKLSAAGVKVELVEVPGGNHGCDLMPEPDDQDLAKFKGMHTNYLYPLAGSFANAFL